MLHRLFAAVCVLLAPVLGAGAADNGWEAKTTDLGMTAVGSTLIASGALAKDWNVLSVGFFCARSQPHFYLYGIDTDHISGGPVRGTLNIDGTAVDLTFWAASDVVATPVAPEFVRLFIRAQAVSVQVKDYNAPVTEQVDIRKAASAIQTALRGCFKP